MGRRNADPPMKAATLLTPVQAVRSCPHPKVYIGSDEDGMSQLHVCVACGARRFENPQGRKGRWRHSTLVRAMLADGSLDVAHRQLKRIASGEFCTKNCTAYIAAEFALKRMPDPAKSDADVK